MNAMRRTLILAIAGLLAGTMLAMTPTAGSAATAGDKQATQPTLERRAYYGAIALAYDNAAAYSYDFRTKRKAKRVALRKCKRASDYPGTCRTVVWVRNGCAAVAVLRRSNGSVDKYGWGIGRTKIRAKRNALRAIPGGRDRIRVWVCTSRRR
jgi:hypothetical protein